MYRIILSAIGLILVSGLSGQKIRPELLERWEPVPPVVTPGTGTAPPSDAVVLFDGTSLDNWERVNGGPAQWKLEDGVMTVVKGAGDIQTKQAFGDVQLHVEWRTPAVVSGESQDRGNSGIFLQKRYEVQVLDNYENASYSNGQAGAIYKQHIPLVNACLPPGEWQTFDIIFTAPRFRKDGRLFSPATMTVLHNGVLVQNHVTLLGPTENESIPLYKAHDLKQALKLQDHSNPVSYRNIWVREL